MNTIQKLSDLIRVKIQRYKNARRTVVPFLYLYITNQCNSPCKTCDIWKNSKSSDELKTHELMQLVHDLKKLGTQVISIAGGEPFLRDDLLFLIKFFSKNGIAIRVVTNGTLLNKEKINEMSLYMKSICFSIDHSDPILYKKIRGLNELENVLQNMKYCQDLGMDVSINLTVSLLNFYDLERIIQDLAFLRPSKIQFIIATRNHQQSNIDYNRFDKISLEKAQLTFLKNKIEILAKKLAKFNIETNSKEFIDHIPKSYDYKWSYDCYAGDLFVGLDSNGDVHGCYEHGKILNIRQKSLFNIINSDEYKAHLTKIKTCNLICHDNGKMEPSLRMNMFYNLKNFKKSLKEYLSF